MFKKIFLSIFLAISSFANAQTSQIPLTYFNSSIEVITASISPKLESGQIIYSATLANSVQLRSQDLHLDIAAESVVRYDSNSTLRSVEKVSYGWTSKQVTFPVEFGGVHFHPNYVISRLFGNGGRPSAVSVTTPFGAIWCNTFSGTGPGLRFFSDGYIESCTFITPTTVTLNPNQTVVASKLDMRSPGDIDRLTVVSGSLSTESKNNCTGQTYNYPGVYTLSQNRFIESLISTTPLRAQYKGAVASTPVLTTQDCRLKGYVSKFPLNSQTRFEGRRIVKSVPQLNTPDYAQICQALGYDTWSQSTQFSEVFVTEPETFYDLSTSQFVTVAANTGVNLLISGRCAGWGDILD